ncbi:MAG: methylenetetrahydrofolate reductase C-terminal domain-containing protein [Kiloniellales bacterium]
MRAMRDFSVRHARFFEALYQVFSGILFRLHPLCKAIGYRRLERPVAAVERRFKGFLFDCTMCGQCVLNSTGMSCPANCPKHLRNGPCGGVRADGMCEVVPHMRCVWVAAYEGSLRMKDGERMRELLPPVDHRCLGTSSWLRVVREANAPD